MKKIIGACGGYVVDGKEVDIDINETNCDQKVLEFVDTFPIDQNRDVRSAGDLDFTDEEYGTLIVFDDSTQVFVKQFEAVLGIFWAQVIQSI